MTPRESQSPPERAAWYRNRAVLVLAAFLAIGAFFLLAEHTAHTLRFLPLGLLVLCPLLHFFLHGGRGGHASDRDHGAHGDRS